MSPLSKYTCKKAFVLLRQRLVPLQVDASYFSPSICIRSSASDSLMRPIVGKFLAPAGPLREIYSDAFHLKRSDTHCSYQQFESGNHLKQKNNEDIKLSGTWEYLIKEADAESRVCCLKKLFGP